MWKKNAFSSAITAREEDGWKIDFIIEVKYQQQQQNEIPGKPEIHVEKNVNSWESQGMMCEFFSNKERKQKIYSIGNSIEAW